MKRFACPHKMVARLRQLRNRQESEWKIKPKVTVWNEFRHEKADPAVLAIYPGGIHGAIAGFLRTGGFPVRTATLDEPEHGLTQEVLDDTDVLIWWGHMAHGEV